MPPWLPLLAAPFAGSFLGVLIRRLPACRPVVWSRSICETCARPLAPRDLVPIASFLALRGRCRQCAAPIPPFHLAVELAACLVPLSLFAVGLRDPADMWPGCALGWTLLALAWIDWSTFLLPDSLTLPLVLAGLACTAWRAPALLTDHASAAALGWSSLWLVATLYRRLRGREGLGGGDAKLFAAAGAWMGLAALPTVLLIAAVTGLVGVGLARLAGRRLTATTRIPFGPALALAIWLIWLWQV